MKIKLKYKQITFVILVLSILSLLFGCNNSSNPVILCDYETITIDEEVYRVSDEDLSFAIKMKLIENSIVKEKESNENVIEEDDIVDITLSINGEKPYDIRIAIGEDEIADNLDEKLIGLNKNNWYEFKISNTIYTVTINNIYMYAEEISDEIAKKYFSFNNAQEMIDCIKKDIEDHRKFEYAYETLLNNSMIMTSYDEKEQFISNSFDKIISLADKADISVENYLKAYYECTVSDYKENLSIFYDEYMILKAVVYKENLEATNKEFDDYLLKLSKETELNETDILNEYGEEYIYYLLYYEKIYPVLLSYV